MRHRLLALACVGQLAALASPALAAGTRTHPLEAASSAGCYVHVAYPWKQRQVRLRIVQRGDILPDVVARYLYAYNRWTPISPDFAKNYKYWVGKLNAISGLHYTFTNNATDANFFVLAENDSVYQKGLDAFTTYASQGGGTFPYVLTSWRQSVSDKAHGPGDKFFVGVGTELGRANIPDPGSGCNERYRGDSIEDAIFYLNRNYRDYGRDDKKAFVRAFGPH